MQYVQCGITQGSILGPLLFLCYINDIYLITKKTFIVLFADDSNIFVQGNNLDDMVDILNSELAIINNWLRANKLSLNVDKTFYMLFEPRRSNVELGKKIEKVTCTRFLGIYIDTRISGVMFDHYIITLYYKAHNNLYS